MEPGQAITAEYATMTQRFKRKEVRKVYEDQTTSDYSMTQLDGQVLDRATVQATVAREMAWIKSVRDMTIVVDDLTITPEGTVVTVRIEATALVVHPRGLDKTDHTLTRKNSARHTWVQTGSGWKMSRAEILSDEGLFDGKPFPTDLLPA